MSDKFESYYPVRTKFVYKTMTSAYTHGDGIVAMVFDPKPAVPSPTLMVTLQEAQIKKTSVPHKSMELTVPSRSLVLKRPNRYLTRPTTSPATPSTDYGTFHIAVGGVSGPVGAIGSLYIEYEIELNVPVAKPGVTQTYRHAKTIFTSDNNYEFGSNRPLWKAMDHARIDTAGVTRLDAHPLNGVQCYKLPEGRWRMDSRIRLSNPLTHPYGLCQGTLYYGNLTTSNVLPVPRAPHYLRTTKALSTEKDNEMSSVQQTWGEIKDIVYDSIAGVSDIIYTVFSAATTGQDEMFGALMGHGSSMLFEYLAPLALEDLTIGYVAAKKAGLNCRAPEGVHLSESYEKDLAILVKPEPKDEPLGPRPPPLVMPPSPKGKEETFDCISQDEITRAKELLARTSR